MTAPIKHSDPITVDVALGDRAYDIVIGRRLHQTGLADDGSMDGPKHAPRFRQTVNAPKGSIVRQKKFGRRPMFWPPPERGGARV